MSFKSIVVDPTRYQLSFQESEPVYVFQEGVFGDDRQQERDPETGYPIWNVRVTACDELNREEQTLEVRLTAKDKPETGRFREEIVIPNLRVQIYSTRQQRGITARWYADAMAPASVGSKTKPAAPPAATKAAA